MAMPRRKSTPNAYGTNSVRSSANRHHEPYSYYYNCYYSYYYHCYYY